jgi:hypothetical protein
MSRPRQLGRGFFVDLVVNFFLDETITKKPPPIQQGCIF